MALFNKPLEVIMRFLLSVIAICLVMITGKLYIPEAQAEVAGMDSYELSSDYDFKRAVKRVIERDCTVYISDSIYVYDEYASLDVSGNVSC